ncbi:MAG: hypothetical protein K8R23_08920 [Chthoniobacter sp.]|nr:hypothetical protein [Chthoniobacter sp.]
MSLTFPCATAGAPVRPTKPSSPPTASPRPLSSPPPIASGFAGASASSESASSGNSTAPLASAWKRSPREKNFCCAKGFGKPLTELPDIQAALAAYVARVGETMRRQRLACGALSVFLLTNPFRTDEPQYHPQLASEFAEPKSFTPDLQHEA